MGFTCPVTDNIDKFCVKKYDSIPSGDEYMVFSTSGIAYDNQNFNSPGANVDWISCDGVKCADIGSAFTSDT